MIAFYNEMTGSAVEERAADVVHLDFSKAFGMMWLTKPLEVECGSLNKP